MTAQPRRLDRSATKASSYSGESLTEALASTPQSCTPPLHRQPEGR